MLICYTLCKRFLDVFYNDYFKLFFLVSLLLLFISFFYYYFIFLQFLCVYKVFVSVNVCEIEGEVGGSLTNRERLDYFFPLLWKIPFYALTYA